MKNYNFLLALVLGLSLSIQIKANYDIVADDSLFVSPPTQISEDITKKVLEQGVPAKAWARLVDFYNKNQWKFFKTKVYSCPDVRLGDVTPCAVGDREPLSQNILVRPHQYAVVIDYALSSVEKRFNLINLSTGVVEKYHVTHGKGSGRGDKALEFSNEDGSHMTSLGLHVTGMTYYGKYGRSLRLYGLDKTNSNSYSRDVVMHSAHYASEAFIFATNRKTGEPFNRLGHSWGCPALPPAVAQKIISAIMNGALVFHDHPQLWK